ncbi:MAG TPA: LEA type 2 family protein [Pyrinomonadaceae bacterium]|nr:LEA type 2 family protein [Pyrinomonadaceae bacterium]
MKKLLARAGGLASAALLAVALGATDASAQRVGGIDIGSIGDIGRAVNVDLRVGEITLESIDFREQTARLNIGLDVRNGLLPVSLKDFDYDLRLFGRQFIRGSHDGTLKVGGRRSSRVDLPVEVSLGEIPGVVWSAFKNRGQVRYEMDAGFTLPLFVTERRFDQSFSGEVPLRSLVDAASILRAERGSGGGIQDRIRDRIGVGGWPF